MAHRSSDFYIDGLGPASVGVRGGGESSLGSELTGSGGAKSNRTLIAAKPADGRVERWSQMFRFKSPWNSSGGRYQSATSGGNNNGGSGGLWLMEDNHDIHQDDALVAAAMNPVSYQNNHSGPDMAEIRHAHYQQQEQQHQAMSSAMYPAHQPLSSSSPTRPTIALTSQGQSHMGSESGGNPSMPSTPYILQPLFEEHLSDSLDYADSHGFKFVPPAIDHNQRQSIESEILPASMSVHLDHIEHNAIFEHVRASPQALPGASENITTETLKKSSSPTITTAATSSTD
ncbi:hypothetical protein BGZ76_002168 [Entomortierella beljakovae]|nr:hypothetical protein BGZ76_002168 [Entomortierella beljakovae]